MPNTVAQHAVATFTSPVNGSTPIDANTVRGNDNTTRTSYNNHDADPGIHVQSSTLASRPVAGTAGRKWITADAGSYKLWYDDGTTWHEVANTGVDVFVVAGEILAKGDVIKVTGYNNGLSAPIVAKVSSASDTAFGIVTGAISNGGTGYITNTGLIADVNTNAFAIGTTLYPNTSGGFTSTKPVAGTYQPVAYVLRSNTNNGVLYVEFSAPRIVERSDNTVSTLVLRDASGNFAAGTVTAALAGNASTAATLQTARNINGVSFNGSADITVTAAANTLTGSTLASGVTASSLTSVGTLTALAVAGSLTAPVTITSSGASTSVSINNTNANAWGSNLAISTGGTPAGYFGTIGSLLGNTTQDIAAYATSGNGFRVYTNGNNLRLQVDSTGNLAVDTNTLFVDAVNNRVGVGTASPTTALDVTGLFNGLQARFGNTAGRGFYVSTALNGGTNEGSTVLDARGGSSGQFLFQTDSVTRATLDTSGNLGLGVTPSAWINGRGIDVGVYVGLSDNPSGGGGFALSGNAYEYASGSWKYKQSYFATLYRTYAGEHHWLTAPSGTAGNAISFTQAMTLNASGNLGVGTASPASRVHIGNGTGLQQAYIDGGGYDLLIGASGGGFMGFASTTISLVFNTAAVPLGIGTNAAQPLLFGTNAFERARIPAAGGMVVGTAALATSATDGFLYVPTCAGTPTGVPTTQTGTAAIVINTTNNKLYFYSGGAWRDAGP